MPSTAEDADVLIAVEKVWDADPKLSQVVPKERRYGGWRLPTVDAKGIGLSLPYAGIKCEKARDPMKFAPVVKGSRYIDFRKVSIAVWVIGEKPCLDMVAILLNAYPEYQPLPIQNADWKRTKLLGGRHEQDPARKAGDDVWRAILELEVWQERTEP